MKKREFLALSGAVPLMMAGCGDGTGHAPVRLVNASVGYPTGLGFMDNSVQAVTNISYGDASAFLNVEAGSQPIALTVTSGSSTTSVVTGTRTLAKDARYSLVAYGFSDELKSVLIPESTVTPDSGDANVNVLNTSVDIGAVDVYISPGTNLDLGTVIASSVTGVTTSAPSSVPVGSYYITVVGANSVAKGISDVRFQSPAPITFTDQQIMTIILTPGASGVLANAIFLTQGTASSAATPVSELNTTYRMRVFANTGTGSSVSVDQILTDSTSPAKSEYVVFTTGTLPTVTVTGVTNAGTITISGATVTAGGDYTLMLYVDSNNNAIATLLLDDNTAPVSSGGVKFRLLNLLSTSPVSMTVNGISAGTNVAYGGASAYKEIVCPQTTNSSVQVFAGATQLIEHDLVLTAGDIFTEVMLTQGSPSTDFFVSSTVD